MESATKIDYSDNTPIKARCECAVRVKPLGAGASDFVHQDEKYANWRYHGCDVEKNEIVFGDVDPKKKLFKYTYPKFIADGTFSQK